MLGRIIVEIVEYGVVHLQSYNNEVLAQVTIQEGYERSTT